jgi:hypothetical protein
VLEDRVLVNGPKWEEGGGKPRELLYEELLNFCSSTHIVRMIKLWGM